MVIFLVVKVANKSFEFGFLIFYVFSVKELVEYNRFGKPKTLFNFNGIFNPFSITAF